MISVAPVMSAPVEDEGVIAAASGNLMSKTDHLELADHVSERVLACMETSMRDMLEALFSKQQAVLAGSVVKMLKPHLVDPSCLQCDAVRLPNQVLPSAETRPRGRCHTSPPTLAKDIHTEMQPGLQRAAISSGSNTSSESSAHDVTLGSPITVGDPMRLRCPGVALCRGHSNTTLALPGQLADVHDVIKFKRAPTGLSIDTQVKSLRSASSYNSLGELERDMSALLLDHIHTHAKESVPFLSPFYKCAYKATAPQTPGTLKSPACTSVSLKGSAHNVETLRSATTAMQLGEFTQRTRTPDVAVVSRSWLPCMLVLRGCGVFPWDADNSMPLCRRPSAWFQWLILSLCAIAIASAVHPLVEMQKDPSKGSACYSSECVQLGLFSDVPLALGSFLGLVSVASQCNTKHLVEYCELLHTYACQEGFDQRWATQACWDLVMMLLLWTLTVGERIRGSGVVNAMSQGDFDVAVLLHIILFSFSSLVLVALAFCMLYVCNALLHTVNTFCIVIVAGGSLKDAVPRWNTVQAMLRTGSKQIQVCLFVLQATVLFTFLLGAIDVYQSVQQERDYVFTLIPGALLTLGISWIFFKAAAITDKCARVPSLINSCTFEADIDLERQYVVEYVLFSSAGFYVFDVCLTSDMILRFAYILVIGVFTLFTKIVSDL